MSLDRSKYIAVSGYNRNTHETSIDVYSFFSSDFRNKPKLLFSIEFEKYVSKGMVYRGRLVSFGPSDGDIVTCLCDSLEIIQNKNVQSSYRRVNGNASCMFVTQNEIFISFYKSRHVTVYDNKQLNVINQINLGGIEEGYFPFDIVAVHGKLYTCVGEDSPGSYSKALSIGEQNGTNLSEFTNSTGEHWYANSIAVNLQLSVVVVVWFSSYYIRQGTRFQIMFYALTNQNYSSFLIVEDESVSRIRLSDTGDRIFTGNQVTGEVKMYDMAEVFTYDELKNYLASELRGDDCVRLSDYFALPKDQRDDILRSTTPTHYLLLALEERCITHPSSVERLTEAFKALQINPACCTVTEIYQKTRMQATIYNRLLATLSAHLTASVREASFRYFKLSDVEKNRITNSQNPGLSLLLTLHELGVIGPSQLVTLTQHFSDQRLVQAVAKIQEYLSVLTEIRNQSLEKSELTYQDKLTLFIRRLKEKIKSWYETMTPVPWKMSCRWKSSELFVGSGLILTDSKTKGSLPSIDEKCKLEYTEIFSHENLESESRIILEGDPGSGKTMLMSQLAYDWAVGKFSEIEILILVPLKFVKDRTLVQAIEEFYLQDESRLTRQDIELFLQNSVSSIHLLLDGLEECTGSANSSGQSDIMKIILKEKYHRCKAVITTRSEFVENLPKSPLVKLGQFGDKERNLYIEKVFADNIDGQKKAKEIMINLPFMLTLCSTPVLFVMVVHNIECMSRSDGDQFQCVSPFIQRILNILCSSWVPTNKTEWPSDRPFEDLCDRNAFAALGTADKGTAKPKSLGTIGHEKVVNSSKKTKHALWKDIPSAECKTSSAIKAMGGSKFYKCSKELLIEPQPDSERSDTTVDSQSAFVGIQHGPSITLEELAFNGLCHGIQQLSWQKGFLERNVINSRHWIESGVIVTEEGHIPLSNFDQNKSEREGLEVKSEPESQGRDDFNTRQNEINMVQDNTGTSLSQTAKSVKKLKSPRVKSQTREGKGNFVKRDLESNSESSDDSDSTTESYINVPSMNDSNSSSEYASETRKSKDTEAKTQTVLAQVQYKFLHKVIQEWFAAKNLSFLLWKSVPSNRLQECLKETLQHISPADLHYILRFTCYLCPPSYRFMVKYLLQNYRSQSIYIPVYIMDCIFLCYAENNGENNTTRADLCTERVIDEQGGTIFLQDADVSLQIPDGALVNGRLIRLTIPMDLSFYLPFPQGPPRVTPLVICEPDDLHFKFPAKLTLPHCAVIRNPDDHKVNVKFGYRDNAAKEMIWKSENVEWSLGEHYCCIYLDHFSGVDASISPSEEKILRVIPYAKLRHNKKLMLNIWLCNDLPSDFQSVMQTEETNAGIPLDSYDTFRLNYLPGPGKSKVVVSLEEMQPNSWRFEDDKDSQVIHPDRLSGSSKSKNSFLLQGIDGADDESYVYLILKVSQTVGEEVRDTTFIIRKMIFDLKTSVMFKKPCCQYENEEKHLFPTDKHTLTYTAVVYMDPIKDRKDDAILTLWLSPCDSTSQMYQLLQKEQELQYKHRVDTENSFLVSGNKLAVISKTQFLNGQWSLSPNEKKIETDRIRCGSRAKFQFIGHRTEEVDIGYIDLQVEVFQEDEEENKITFSTDVEITDLLYNIRRSKVQGSTFSVVEKSSDFASKAQGEGLHPSVSKSLLSASYEATQRMPEKHVVSGNQSLSQMGEQLTNLEERLRKCFMSS